MIINTKYKIGEKVLIFTSFRDSEISIIKETIKGIIYKDDEINYIIGDELIFSEEQIISANSSAFDIGYKVNELFGCYENGE